MDAEKLRLLKEFEISYRTAGEYSRILTRFSARSADQITGIQQVHAYRQDKMKRALMQATPFV